MKNNNIEKFKVLSIIMVIAIHITAPLYYANLTTFFNYDIYRKILNFGVNFFFAVSGYFLASHKSVDKTKKNFLKNSSLYVFASFLVIMLNAFLAIINKVTLKLSLKTGLGNIVKNITIANVFKGTFGSYHLWFFASLLIVLMFYYYFFKKKFDTKKIVFFTTIIYILLSVNIFNLNLYCDVYGIARGLLFALVGYLAYETKKEYKFSLILSLLSMFLISFLVYFKIFNMERILFIFMIYMLFNYLKFNPGKETFFSKLGAKTSHVYIIHDFFMRFFRIIYTILGINSLNFVVLELILVTIVSFLLATPIYNISFKIYSKIIAFIFKEKNL